MLQELVKENHQNKILLTKLIKKMQDETQVPVEVTEEVVENAQEAE